MNTKSKSVLLNASLVPLTLKDVLTLWSEHFCSRWYQTSTWAIITRVESKINSSSQRNTLILINRDSLTALDSYGLDRVLEYSTLSRCLRVPLCNLGDLSYKEQPRDWKIRVWIFWTLTTTVASKSEGKLRRIWSRLLV